MRILAVLFPALLFLGVSLQAQAQNDFEPKNYADCVMLYAKKARTDAGIVLMRRVCKCRFQETPPAECATYSKEAMDCFLKNAISIQEENQVDGIKRACEKQHPLQ